MMSSLARGCEDVLDVVAVEAQLGGLCLGSDGGAAGGCGGSAGLGSNATARSVTMHSTAEHRAQDTGVDQIKSIIAGMQSDDVEMVTDATQKCRELLSTTNPPPINVLVGVGLVETLVHLLAAHDHPLLQFEAAWTLSIIASGSNDAVMAIMRTEAPLRFIALLSESLHENVRTQSVWALAEYAGHSCECRDYLLENGILPPLLAVLSAPETVSWEMLRTATWAVANLCRGCPKPELETVRAAIPVLADLCTSGDDELIANATWALAYLSDDSADDASGGIHAVLQGDVVNMLSDFLVHPKSTVSTPALKAVGNLLTGSADQTQMVLASGALAGLACLARSPVLNTRKEACWALSNVAAGTAKQLTAVFEVDAVEPLLTIMREDEDAVSNEAAWAIANIVSGGTLEQVEHIMHNGGVPAFARFLDNHKYRVVLMALEAFAKFLEAGITIVSSSDPNWEFSHNPAAALMEAAGAIKLIVQLTTHTDPEVCTAASTVLNGHFPADTTHLLQLQNARSEYM
jgi:importin subunit alpha-1